MKKTGKILIWTGVIAVVGVAGYLAYKQYKAKQEAEAKAARKNQIIKEIGTGLGSLISGLFKKDEPQLTEGQQAALQYSILNPFGRV